VGLGLQNKLGHSGFEAPVACTEKGEMPPTITCPSACPLQGSLSHKRKSPSPGPPQGLGHISAGGSDGGAVSYERGTPVHTTRLRLATCGVNLSKDKGICGAWNLQRSNGSAPVKHEAKESLSGLGGPCTVEQWSLIRPQETIWIRTKRF